MKRAVFLFSLMIFFSTLYAQRHKSKYTQVKWLNIAVKGGFGGTMLFNKDISADENVAMDFLSPSYSVGGRFGITYGNYIGVSLDVLSSGFSQSYSFSSTTPYTKKQKFKSLDLFVALRFTSPYGFYFEAGPQFSTLKSAAVENSIESTFNEAQNGDYMANFADKFTSIAAGLGFAIHNGDRLIVNLGLRGTYGIGNFEENDNYYVLDDGVYTPQGSSTAITNPFTLKAMIELNYIFGFWGDANCGRGRLMFFQ